MFTSSKNKLSRRDFLKLASLAPLSWFVRPLTQLAGRAVPGNASNIIILVFDAWSADHVQFYGYPRRTMPNLERFAQNATVFHNHYTAGTFTTPGTASLLTGLYPWTHRALSLGTGGLIDSQVDHNAFAIFGDTHSTFGYAQNKFADVFLFQFGKYLDTHLPAGAFNMERRFVYNLPWFQNDARIALAGLEINGFQDNQGHGSSLFMSPLARLLRRRVNERNALSLSDEYPLGLPDDTEQFLLSDVVDGAIDTLRMLDQPAFAYLHFWPPHDAYAPHRKFYKMFAKGWQPPVKPIHRLSWERKSYEDLNQMNQSYDEYIASWDAELGRLFQSMRDSGLLDRSYVVITADHGELNERGERGHFTPIIFNPLIHIPLIISSPGQKERADVHTLTSSVDVLPTLAHLAGKTIPDWVEGQLLPGLGGLDDPQRSVYSMDAKTNAAFAPLTKLTTALTKDHYRLVYYKYPDDQQFEFYDLREDPNELNDLYPSSPSMAVQMREELLQKLADVDAPFEGE